MSDPQTLPGQSKSRWLKPAIAILLGAAFALLSGTAAWIWLQQERMLFNPVVLPAQTTLSQDADVKEVWVEVPDARLSGLHLQQANAKGLVFFLHGNAGNLQTWFTNPAFYRQAGYDLFMIDYRGFGKSTGRIESEAQLRADVRAAWNQVAPQYAGKKIVLYGRSLGSGLAAGLAADLADARQPPDLTVLVSPYLSMVALADDHMPALPHVLVRYPLRTDQQIGKIRSPLLLFHGDQDTLIALRYSQQLQQLAPKAKLVTVLGAAHNDVHKFPVYLDAYRAALDAL